MTERFRLGAAGRLRIEMAELCENREAERTNTGNSALRYPQWWRQRLDHRDHLSQDHQ
jgi:hypothetical protein